MFICFAGHGVVNKKKERESINVIEKNDFFILHPPLLLKYNTILVYIT
jgi:hypothetical protein